MNNTEATYSIVCHCWAPPSFIFTQHDKSYTLTSAAKTIVSLWFGQISRFDNHSRHAHVASSVGTVWADASLALAFSWLKR